MVGLLGRIQLGDILICDGAMGTQLMARGLTAGECPDAWCLSRPDDVRQINQSYANAGSDIVETNSFGASPIKLAGYGIADKAQSINRAAAQLAREAMGSRGFVAGSVGPTGQFMKGEGGQLSEEDAYQAFATQIAALAEGGADSICVETMWSVREASQAIRAARQGTNLPVLCTFTFNPGKRGFRTAVGLTPAAAAKGALDAGADVIGANCGTGIDHMIEIARELRAAFPTTPIMIQPNAGLPVFEEGQTVYKETPEYMSSKIGELVALGVNIVGGCCGTTPQHITAMKRSLHDQPVR